MRGTNPGKVARSAMVQRISEDEVERRFAEICDRVADTQEPVVILRDGRPDVALVSTQDLEAVERARAAAERAATFTRLAAAAARARTEPDVSEAELVEQMKRTREAIYQERYGSG
jgi:prevent-host-death family protein